MGIFDRVFGRNKEAKHSQESLKLINGYTPVFTSAPESIYEMDLIRACIHQYATMCAKLKPSIKGSAYKELRLILENQPNPYMDTYKFLYRIATILAVNNTVFIAPIEDERGWICGYYPLIPKRCEASIYDGEEYLIYSFANGKKGAVELRRVGILTNFQYRDDLMGERNTALHPTMQLICTVNQGMTKAVENSAKIQFLARVGNNYKEEDIKKAQREFMRANLSSENQSGLMVIDNKFLDLKQIDYKPFNIDEGQQRLIKNNIFNYFGINEEILQNAFNEDKWNAYFEGKIEPFALQLSIVLSNMTFSKKELAFGNGIEFTSNRLQYASNATKISMAVQMFDRGIFNRNQIMELFGLPHVENGDKYYIRREYADIDNLEKETETNAENDQ